MQDNPLIIYKPWSPNVIKLSMKKFSGGFLPALDIELSAQCNHNSCIYCDSHVGFPSWSEPSFDQLKSVIDEGKDLGVEWVYICGLGEPANDDKFFRLIRYLHENEISVSIFSNGIGYSRADVKYLKNNEVNLILKLDSFNEVVFDHLLGKKGSARQIYKTLQLLLEEGYAERNIDNYSDLAFSIVITKMNLCDIPMIVKYCKENNIFPSVGELEYSGKAKDLFNKLSPSRDELIDLKNRIDLILGYDYKKPVCPSAIAGLHLNNLGKYVIDEKTGLSCSWYLLMEPRYLEIGQIGDTLRRVLDRMIQYRKGKLNNIDELIKMYSSHVFGGCGGDIKTLLDLSALCCI